MEESAQWTSSSSEQHRARRGRAARAASAAPRRAGPGGRGAPRRRPRRATCRRARAGARPARCASRRGGRPRGRRRRARSGAARRRAARTGSARRRAPGSGRAGCGRRARTRAPRTRPAGGSCRCRTRRRRRRPPAGRRPRARRPASSTASSAVRPTNVDEVRRRATPFILKGPCRREGPSQRRPLGNGRRRKDGRPAWGSRAVWLVSGREGERRPGDRGGSGTPTPAQRGWGCPALERGSRGTARSRRPGGSRRSGCGSARLAASAWRMLMLSLAMIRWSEPCIVGPFGERMQWGRDARYG